MGAGVPCEAGGTELALRPRGVVGAAQAVASVRLAELGRARRVCVTTAVTGDTPTVGTVESSLALVTLLTAVFRQALVTHWEPIRVNVTGASGGGVGTGAGDTGIGGGSTRAAVEPRLAFLTVGSLSVGLAVQTDARLRVAVVSKAVALTGLAPSAAETEEAWVALVTLGPVHSRLTHTHS